jgi:DNA-directed RNA polymerase I, II, and III subunit RPABC2
MDVNNTNNESSPYLELNNSNNNSNQINDLIEEFDDLKATYHSMLTRRDRKTIPILSKYERARVVGERAIQISMGAPPLVEVGNLENPVDIAEKELREKKIPYIIKRVLPNGLIELWSVDELRID